MFCLGVFFTDRCLNSFIDNFLVQRISRSEPAQLAVSLVFFMLSAEQRWSYQNTVQIKTKVIHTHAYWTYSHSKSFPQQDPNAQLVPQIHSSQKMSENFIGYNSFFCHNNLQLSWSSLRRVLAEHHMSLHTPRADWVGVFNAKTSPDRVALASPETTSYCMRYFDKCEAPIHQKPFSQR